MPVSGWYATVKVSQFWKFAVSVNPSDWLRNLWYLRAELGRAKPATDLLKDFTMETPALLLEHNRDARPKSACPVFHAPLNEGGFIRILSL
jgi:hypothetical protein